MTRKHFDDILIERANTSRDTNLIVTPKRTIQRISELQGQTKEIIDETHKFYEHITKKSWSKVIKSYQDFRVKYGPEQALMLTRVLLKTQQVLLQNGSVHFGVVHNGQVVRPILPPNMAKVYNLYIDESINVFRAINNSYFVPPSISYDVNDFDCSKLEKLLDVTNYKLNEFGDVRSSNISLKSKDKLHTVVLSYALHPTESAFTVKYMAFGFKIDDKRDKFDLCYKVDFTTNRGTPLHIEANLEIQELIDTNPSLDFSVLSQKVRNIRDSQVKVDRKTGNAFFTYQLNNEQKREDHPNYIKQLANSDLLAKRPLLLGGGVFDYAVKFGLENQHKLLELKESFLQTNK